MNLKITSIIVFTVLILSFIGFTVSGQDQEVSPGDAYYTTAPQWSHDGTRVATVDGNRVLMWDAATRTTQLIFSGHTDKIYALAWHPADTQLASTSRDQTVRVWNTETGELIQIIAAADWIPSLDWSPDGKLIAGTGGIEQIATYVWDAETGELKGHYPGGQSPSAAFSSDGNYFSFVVGSKIIVMDTTNFMITAELGELNDHNNPIATVSWSSDNKRMVTGSYLGGVYIWEIGTSSSPLCRLIANDMYGTAFRPGYIDLALAWVKAIDFTPDGSFVQSVSGDGTVRQWDLTNGNLVMESHIPPNRTAAWSQYGGRLAYQGLSDQQLASGFALTDSQLQIAIPLASLDLLKAIVAGCLSESAILQTSLDTLTTDDLPAFIAEIKELPPDAIPPACATDLIAVAEAIIKP